MVLLIGITCLIFGHHCYITRRGFLNRYSAAPSTLLPVSLLPFYCVFLFSTAYKPVRGFWDMVLQGWLLLIYDITAAVESERVEHKCRRKTKKKKKRMPVYRHLHLHSDTCTVVGSVKVNFPKRYI